MLVTKQPVLRRFWYPVMPMENLADGLQPFTLLGERIVLWLGPDGAPAAVEDRCCHRTARLSFGFVAEGCLVCKYHGWTYDGTGRLVRMPQAREPDRPPPIAIRSYRCRERYGYAWVCLDEPIADIPVHPEALAPGNRIIHEFYEVWKAAPYRYVENVLDFSHFPFVHPATFGDDADMRAVREEIEEFDWGLTSTVHVPFKGVDQQRKNMGLGEISDGWRTTARSYYLPFSRKVVFGEGRGHHTIISNAVPIDDGTMMFVQFVVRSDTEEETSAASLIAWDRAVISEDKELVESTDPDVALDPADDWEHHNALDRAGVAGRRLLRRLLERHGETESRSEARRTRIAPRLAADTAADD